MSAAPRSLLWITHYAVSPGEGGGTRHFELGQALSRLGWRVTLAASGLNLHTRQYSRRAGPGSRETVAETIGGGGVPLVLGGAVPPQRLAWVTREHDRRVSAERLDGVLRSLL